MFLADGLLGSAAADSVAIVTGLGTAIDSFLPGIDPKIKALVMSAGAAGLFHVFEKAVKTVLDGGYKSKFTENWTTYSAFINPVLVTVLGYIVARFFHAGPLVAAMTGMTGAGLRAAAIKLKSLNKVPGAAASTAVAMLALLSLPTFDASKLHYDVGAAVHSERFTASDQYSTRYTVGLHYALTNHIVPKVQYFKPFGKDKHAGGEASINVTF